MVEETDIAVVGAGGGGAVLALALAQKGINTIVFEQAPGPPKGLRGEILQPNGQQVSCRLSLPVRCTSFIFAVLVASGCARWTIANCLHRTIKPWSHCRMWRTMPF